MRVFITATAEFPVDEETVRTILNGIADVRTIELPHKVLSAEEEDVLIKNLRGVDALLLRPGIISKRVIDATDRLKIIAVHGAGVDQVDIQAATAKGVFVTNVPGGNANAVAELTFGLILSVIRGISRADRLVREGKWEEARFLGTELRGKTMGIIGLGRIGSRVAKIAKAFGMKILTYDPYISQERVGKVGVTSVNLETLLKESDVVTIHVPLTEETMGMIGKRELKLMKRSAILINMARGAIVDEVALYEGLKKGIIAGAALDVLKEEPPSPNNPIFQLENVVITPHMGGSSTRALKIIARVAAEDIAKVLRGEPPKNLVNTDVISRCAHAYSNFR